MARGRMISTTIALDPEFNAMSMEAQLCFLRTVPHLDRDGLIMGQPTALWAMIAPLQPHLLPCIPDIVEEWKAAGLVKVFDTKIGPILYFDGFHRNQSGLRYDREPASRYPLPEDCERTPNGIRRFAGRLPEDCRQSAGKVPLEGEVEVEVEVEVEREGKAASPPPSAPPALVIFHEFCTKNTRINQTQTNAILSAITDLDLWRRVLTEWSLRGYNPANVAGLLDWYRDGIPSTPKNGNVKHGNRSPSRDAHDAPDDPPQLDPKIVEQYAELKRRKQAAAS